MLDRDTVDSIIELACRAPSVHNTQPWRWRVYDDHVELLADLSRQLVHADPQRRDLMISCGAALHHFQVAARATGWSTRVRRTPDHTDERIIADITLTSRPLPSDADDVLQAIARRRTDRRRLSSWPLPPERLAGLAMTGNQWGAQVLPVQDESARARLERLTSRADEVQRSDPAYLVELTASTTYWDDHGVPVTHIPKAAAVGSGSWADSGGGQRRFPHGVLDDPSVPTESSSDGMLLITSSSDDAMSRVRAGEALSAIWLEATRGNLSVVPLSQALEVEETRGALQGDVLGDLAVAQLILRVGWLPTGLRELTPTPRRTVDDVRERC